MVGDYIFFIIIIKLAADKNTSVGGMLQFWGSLLIEVKKSNSLIKVSMC